MSRRTIADFATERPISSRDRDWAAILEWHRAGFVGMKPTGRDVALVSLTEKGRAEVERVRAAWAAEQVDVSA